MSVLQRLGTFQPSAFGDIAVLLETGDDVIRPTHSSPWYALLDQRSRSPVEESGVKIPENYRLGSFELA